VIGDLLLLLPPAVIVTRLAWWAADALLWALRRVLDAADWWAEFELYRVARAVGVVR
jgi:hypothetical protein